MVSSVGSVCHSPLWVYAWILWSYLFYLSLLSMCVCQISQQSWTKHVNNYTRIAEYAQSDWLHKSCQLVNCGELEGNAVVPAVICWLLTIEVQVHSWAGMVWDLWWTKWHSHRFFLQYTGFPVSIIPLPFHTYLTNTLVSYKWTWDWDAGLWLVLVKNIPSMVIKELRHDTHVYTF